MTGSSAEEERIARQIALGLVRAFGEMGETALTEVTLANGRRADVLALDAAGRLTIVEIKSSRADFQSDRKWREYLEFCDAFYFAVAEGFPVDLLPEDVGLMIADRWSAHVVREALLEPLSAPRRKAMLIRFGLLAGDRLRNLVDPPL
ncbi:MAG: MmcB family DNA repair protein [Rhodospirillaceae bacterium]|nr:MmcB family DNA repair protein [Rhodospirillaceae bacterium]